MKSNAIVRVSALQAPIGVWLIWAYAFWLMTTPEQAPRFELLVTMRFERILAGALIILSLGNATARWRDSKPIILMASFFAVSYISSIWSPAEVTEYSQHWTDNYWKLCLLFCFVVVNLKSITDLYLAMLGISAISVGYQLLSWRDSLAGGSYVWQQGVKRMVGVWSGGGIGAANGFAFLALTTLPFCYCWYLRDRRPRGRLTALGGATVSLASIVFSGTRGAMVVAAIAALGGILLFLANRTRYLLWACLITVAAWGVMPVELHHRFAAQLFESNSSDGRRDRYDKIAAD